MQGSLQSYGKYIYKHGDWSLQLVRACDEVLGDVSLDWYDLGGILTHWGPDKNGHHFTDDMVKCIFLNENVRISLKILLKFVPKVWINMFQHWFR